MNIGPVTPLKAVAAIRLLSMTGPDDWSASQIATALGINDASHLTDPLKDANRWEWVHYAKRPGTYTMTTRGRRRLEQEMRSQSIRDRATDQLRKLRQAAEGFEPGLPPETRDAKHRLHKRKAEVLALIQANPGTSVPRLCDMVDWRIGYPSGAVGKIVKRLADDGAINRVAPNPVQIKGKSQPFTLYAKETKGATE